MKSFKVDPYDWRIFLFRDREKWARSVSRKLGELKLQRANATDAVGICSFDFEGMQCRVGVFDGKAGTLAHEMTHAAMMILGSAGVRVTPENNEALAYLVGFMVDKASTGAT